MCCRLQRCWLLGGLHRTEAPHCLQVTLTPPPPAALQGVTQLSHLPATIWQAGERLCFCACAKLDVNPSVLVASWGLDGN